MSMNTFIRPGFLANTLRNGLLNGVAVRFLGRKNDGLPPLCAEPSQSSCSRSPEPPPCPPPPSPCGPPCPPPYCTTIPDPNNPCNYVPPESPNADEPDLTKIKKYQCLYQQEDGIPVYLKKGPMHVYYFQFVTIFGGIVFIQTLFTIFTAFKI